MAEDGTQYLNKLNKIEMKLIELEEEKRKKFYQQKKEDLKTQYNLAKIKNRSDATEWIEKKFEWSETLLKLLREKFKFRDFRAKQLAAINATLSKKDVLLLMPTGGGKSLVYQLPALVTKGLTLVVSAFNIINRRSVNGIKEIGYRGGYFEC
ncbi:hypothetical protein NQ318_014552 [Aromia moschata]|uniref:DNA 3'-5' helicase n=1 Tax=Aromia moschata TaxID=1265417 RepID=A0AAV8XHC8_9CUCU|nr:hypothetical protein NQ318_014552 [Aromia moschata]